MAGTSVGQEENPLIARVIERQKFIEAVFRYVDAMLYGHGTVLKEDVHDNYICVTKELKSFEFSFWSDGPHTMFGGEEFKVWLGENLVLHVRFHRIDDCTVVHFDPSPAWQQAIGALAGAHAAALAQAEAGRKAREEAERCAREEEERRAKATQTHAALVRDLAKHTKRLGFV